jgi:hypothetical protein
VSFISFLDIEINNNKYYIPMIESPAYFAYRKKLPNTILEIADKLHNDGFAIIDFPDTDIQLKADSIKKTLTPRFDFESWKRNGWETGSGMRLTDEWVFNAEVRSIASNPTILELLEHLFGRKAFPFQTLNFPVGTQQSVHSDTMHFNTIPERWMCGVWVALEDIDENNGPLVYYPETHKWPVLWGEHLGLDLSKIRSPGQHLFEPAWQNAIAEADIKPKYLHCKQGHALIWLSNLLHGGARQLDKERTRWSQVTHYYFEDCTYWRPYVSNLSSGNIFTFQPPNVLSGQKYVVSEDIRSKLPNDFDVENYKLIHQDLSGLSDAHAMEHWVLNGKFEGRPYK